MKTIKLIAVAFAALAAVSCVKDNMGGADSKTVSAVGSIKRLRVLSSSQSSQ